MDWAIVTWAILIGIVGLLWVMAMAVIQDKSQEAGSASRNSSSEEPKSEPAIEPVQEHQRSAA